MNNLRLTVFKYITGRNLRVLTLKEQITNLIGKKIVLNLVEVSSEWRGSSGGIEKTTQCQGGMTQLLTEPGKSGMGNSSEVPMLGTLWTSGSSPVKCWASEMISKASFSSTIL